MFIMSQQLEKFICIRHEKYALMSSFEDETGVELFIIIINYISYIIAKFIHESLFSIVRNQI